MNSPKFVRSFTSVDAPVEEKLKRSPFPPPERDSIDMKLGSPVIQRISPSLRSPDESPYHRTHIARNMFKAKSRVLNELSVTEIPDVSLLFLYSFKRK